MKTYLVQRPSGTEEYVSAKNYQDLLGTLRNRANPFMPIKIYEKVTQYQLIYKKEKK